MDMCEALRLASPLQGATSLNTTVLTRVGEGQCFCSMPSAIVLLRGLKQELLRRSMLEKVGRYSKIFSAGEFVLKRDDADENYPQPRSLMHVSMFTFICMDTLPLRNCIGIENFQSSHAIRLLKYASHEQNDPSIPKKSLRVAISQRELFISF